MNADADVNLFGGLFLGVVGPQLRLNLLGALHGVNDGGKVHQEGVAHGFDDRAMMFSNGLLNNLVMDIEQAQHAGFIRAHLAAEAHDVGEHDGGQPAGLGLPRLVRFDAHGGDYGRGSGHLPVPRSTARHVPTLSAMFAGIARYEIAQLERLLPVSLQRRFRRPVHRLPAPGRSHSQRF